MDYVSFTYDVNQSQYAIFKSDFPQGVIGGYLTYLSLLPKLTESIAVIEKYGGDDESVLFFSSLVLLVVV